MYMQYILKSVYRVKVYIWWYGVFKNDIVDDFPNDEVILFLKNPFSKPTIIV